MLRDRIALASTARLQARIDDLQNILDEGDLDDLSNAEDFPDEFEKVERELDARYYANHEDARVRQGMGEVW